MTLLLSTYIPEETWRFKILSYVLKHQGATVTATASGIGTTWSHVYNFLPVLKRKGFVIDRKERFIQPTGYIQLVRRLYVTQAGLDWVKAVKT